MVAVFVENKHIFLKNMTNVIDKYSFAYLPMAKGEKNIIKKIVLSMYKDNIQIKRKENLSTFHKVDLPFLCFFIMVGYYRHLLLAYFANDFTFRSHILDISCYNNCLYSLYKGANAGDNSSMPNEELYNIIMRHFLYYLKINKWHRH